MEPWNEEETPEILEAKIKEILKIKKSYDDVIDTLEFLPTKVEHEAIVPIAGSNLAFFRGSIVNTNSVVMQLSSEYYVKRTTASAVQSLSRRRQTSINLLNGFQLKLQQQTGESEKATVAPPSVNKRAEKPQPTKTGWVPPAAQQNQNCQPADEPDKSFSGVRKTADGFFEIIERIADEEFDELSAKPVSRREVDTAAVLDDGEKKPTSQETVRNVNGFLDVVERDPCQRRKRDEDIAPARQSLFSKLQAEKKARAGKGE